MTTATTPNSLPTTTPNSLPTTTPNSLPATTLPTPSGARASVAAPRVTFGRLALVEFRKLVDTRSSFWLLISIFAAATIVAIATVVLVPADFQAKITAQQAALSGSSVLQILLPVMAIMLVTSEWSQRAGLVTFSLEPRRLRVLFAKTVAVIATSLALFALVTGFSVGVVAAARTFGHSAIVWSFDGPTLALAALYTVVCTLMGLGFGALLMNTPAAIVAFFLVPNVLAMASLISQAVADALVWIRLDAAYSPLIQGTWDHVQWGPIAASTALWVVLPLVAGGVRLVRREIA